MIISTFKGYFYVIPLVYPNYATLGNNDRWIAIQQSFEAEDTNSVELQRDGWQSILDNFKKYAEGQIK